MGEMFVRERIVMVEALAKITSATRQVVISRTPRREGEIFQVSYDESGATFPVLLETVRKPVILGISKTEGWQLSFQHPSTPMKAFVSVGSPKVLFWNSDGQTTGRLRESAFSIFGKFILEDELKSVIGWIKSGMKKDRILSANGLEVGAFVRAPSGKLPLVMKPSEAYRLARYELRPLANETLYWRLVYAFISLCIFSEYADYSAS